MDKIIINGAVYTMDSQNPTAEAVAIENNIIKKVGTTEEIMAMANENTEILDMKGKMVLPGFIDAHCHPGITAFFHNVIHLSEAESQQELLETVRREVELHPEKDSYMGEGYLEVMLAGTGYSKELLDKICPDKPIFLMGSSCHEGWANSKTFELAGITKDTPDPKPGFQYFERDENGEPTGRIVETEATTMILKEIEFFDKDILDKSYMEMSDEFSSVGITSLAGCGDFDWMGDLPKEVFDRLAKNKEINLRNFDCVFVDAAEKAYPALDKLKKFSKMYDTDYHRVNTYKVILDGTFETESASVSFPYIEGYESIPPVLEGKEIENLYVKVAEEGFDLHTHAIGDRAAHASLQGAEAVRNAGFDDIRITNAHTQFVKKEDRKRFGQLNVIANTSGGWHYWHPEAIDAMGKLENDFFTLKEIMDGGTIITMGSDRPADEVGFDPRLAITTAMTRKYPYPIEGHERLPLQPEDQKLSLQTCLEAYTVNAAHQIRMDGKLGQIKDNAYADIVVFERDMFEITPEEIIELPITMTIFDGRVVYKNI